nr:SURF1 family protein [uncultured Rhodoferax sp.]
MGLFAGFVGLGVWQLQRLAWKQDLIDRVGQRLTAPASDLPTPEEWPELQAQDFEYRHVRVQGNWLHRHTVLTQATTVLGQGFWVITPLQQVDGSAVLVNRGFIPAQQRNQWLHAPSAPADSGKLVVIQGLMRQTEPKGGFLRRNDPQNQKWYSRDVAAIAAAQQLPLTAPFFVDVGLPDVTLHAYAESQPASIGPWPREGLTIVRFSNSHKVYALTWFALAIMVVGAGVLVTRYERRLRSAHHNSGHGHPQ